MKLTRKGDVPANPLAKKIVREKRLRCLRCGAGAEWITWTWSDVARRKPWRPKKAVKESPMPEPTPYDFARRGESGRWFREALAALVEHMHRWDTTTAASVLWSALDRLAASPAEAPEPFRPCTSGIGEYTHACDLALGHDGPCTNAAPPAEAPEAVVREELDQIRDAAERVVCTAEAITERQGDYDVVVGYRHQTGAMHALIAVLRSAGRGCVTRGRLDLAIREAAARAAAWPEWKKVAYRVAPYFDQVGEALAAGAALDAPPAVPAPGVTLSMEECRVLREAMTPLVAIAQQDAGYLDADLCYVAVGTARAILRAMAAAGLATPAPGRADAKENA